MAFAALVDKARRMPKKENAACSGWDKDGNVWRTALTLEDPRSVLLLTTFGDAEVWLNGACVGRCVLDEEYRDIILWACDLKGSAVRGANALEIRWKDVSQHGGMTSQLPFGAFEEKTVGVYGMTVCSE